MFVGNNVAINFVKLEILQPLVTSLTANDRLATLKAEIISIVDSMILSAPSGEKTSPHFKISWDAQLTFQAIFATPKFVGSEVEVKEYKLKDQHGKITTSSVNVFQNASVYIPVVGQLFRAIYLRRLFLLNEPSQDRTLRLAEIDSKIEELSATSLIIAPVVDELIGVVDGSIYLYKDTIVNRFDMYQVVKYSDLPSRLKSDFSLLQLASTAELYALPGYTPGMNTGIESALTTRGALAHLNPDSPWLQIASDLSTNFTLNPTLAAMLTYEAPKLLGLLTLARKSSSFSSDMTLAELDRNTMDFMKLLRKLSNRSDLSLVSVKDLKGDLIEVAAVVTSDVLGLQQVASVLYCALGVSNYGITYSGSSTEAFKRQVRLWSSQTSIRAKDIIGATVSRTSDTVFTITGTAGNVATVTVSGPFSKYVVDYNVVVEGSIAAQQVFDSIDVMSALVENVRLFKTYSIDPTTGVVSFTYTIDQLRQTIVEYLVDFSVPAFKRS